MSYILPRLSRTLQSFFRIGTIRIKDNSGTIEARDESDTSYADVRASGFKANNGVYSVNVSAPTLSGNVTFVLPAASGANGQALVANGSGGHFYQNVDGATNTVKVEQINFTQATSSPATIATLPAGIRVLQVATNVNTAAGAGTPTIQVVYGTGNTPVTLTTDSDLLTPGNYVVPMAEDVTASEVFKLLITPDGQTFAGDVVITYALPS